MRGGRELPGTVLEFIPQVGELRDDSIDLMAAMSRAADRSLNWNFIQVYAQNKEFVDHQLTAATRRPATAPGSSP